MSPKRPRPAVIRYYFDADILGLAKLVGQIRADVTFPGDPGGVIRQTCQRAPCIITDTATPDLEWIPQVAARGWSIVTRDRHIAEHPAEREAVAEHGAKMFVIGSPMPLLIWDQLEIIMSQWRAIERLGDERGPFIYILNRVVKPRLVFS